MSLFFYISIHLSLFLKFESWRVCYHKDMIGKYSVELNLHICFIVKEKWDEIAYA